MAKCEHNTVKKPTGYWCPSCGVGYDCAACLGEHRESTHEPDVSRFCDHCGGKDDGCTCWMLDPVYTGEATI